MKILKTITYILPVIGLLIGTASCSDEYNESLTATTDPHYLNVDKTSMNYSSYKGTQSLGVTSVGVSWTLSNNALWVSLDKDNGSSSETVNVSVEEYGQYSASGRSATLQLSGAGANTRNITVNQESPGLALSVSPASVELKATEGSSANISVVCNNEWSVSIADESWLTATKSNGGITVTAKENTTGAARSNTISISSASEIKTVKITQNAANTTVSSETLAFGHAASKKTLSILSDASWTIKTNYSWIDVTPTNGSAGTTNISVAVTKNTSADERIGSFSIGTKEVKVTQEGVSLSVSPSALSFAEAGETLPLTIKSNTTWKISSTNSDISFSKTEGDGDATIKVTMPRNTGTVKQFLATVEATDGSSQKEMISISQDGSGMSDITGVSTFAKEGGKIDYTVPALSNWTAEVPSECSSWIHITPTSGNKDATITITVDKTTDINDRSGYFILTYDFGAKYRVIINQYGAGILTSVSSCQFFAKGGTSEAITVQSSGDVTSSTSADWLTAKQNGNLLTITASENLTGAVRTGTVTLQLKGKTQTVAITVTQAGQHGDLTVDGYGSDVNLVGIFVSSITISPTNSTMYVGDTKTLTATISPSDADNKNVTWSSSNTSVATVSSSGVVTAKSVGTATITATAADGGGAMATSIVTVEEVKVSSISLSQSSVSMTVGETKTLTATAYPTNAANKNIIWKSSNTSVATVSSSGVVTAKAVGTATIYANATDGGGAMATCKIMVTAAPEAVDLGLSVKWATFNVGAIAPEDSGDYYAWGETETKNSYSWETYKWCNGTQATLTKYCTDSKYGTVDNKTTLDLEDDAAHVNWGGNWRMPTAEEYHELYEKCSWEKTTLNGIEVIKITSTNGNYIYMTRNCFWMTHSSNNYASLFNCADDNLYPWGVVSQRCYRNKIRPVCP